MLTPQNAVTAFDIASLNGHQDICDELEYHTSQETKTEITEVSGSVGVHVLASAPVGVGYKYVVALLLARVFQTITCVLP